MNATATRPATGAALPATAAAVVAVLVALALVGGSTALVPALLVTGALLATWLSVATSTSVGL